MKQRGSGNFGVEFKHPRDGMMKQWFKSELLRNGFYGNLCRDPKYTIFKKVEK